MTRAYNIDARSKEFFLSFNFQLLAYNIFTYMIKLAVIQHPIEIMTDDCTQTVEAIVE